jgi:hypothetical protein
MKDERPEISPEPSAVAGGGEEGPPLRSTAPYSVHTRAATVDERTWLATRLGFCLTPDARGVAAVDDIGAIRAMVVFDQWTDNAAEAHMCSEDPRAVWPLMRAALGYFFTTTGRSVLLGRVRASNTKALAFDARVGFRETCRIRDGFAVGDDMVILEMHRDDCRWLRENSNDG